MRIAWAAICVALLAGCGTGAPRGPAPEIIDRILKGVPGDAQPSAIVATEIAYARAAREQGQYTAALSYANPDAVLHGRNGPVPVQAALGGIADPADAVAFGTRAVVMSCDGALAVALGRFRDPEGQVGNYVTVWQRQPDRTYRWTYDVAGRDDPQPPPREDPEEGDIIVTAFDAVDGLIADCPERGAAVPAAPTIAPIDGLPNGSTVSRDRTLRWRWEHRPDGIKYVAADYWFDGQWRVAIEEALASPAE